MKRESCVLCAAKHVAQARVLILESRRGYPEHYYFALGHLAEAEDELEKHHLELARAVRAERKKLEEDHDYRIPFSELVLKVAVQGEEETEARIKAIEKEFSEMSDEELQSWWNEKQ